ncbi:MAG: peptide deformylase [Pseudomonadota bacterium]
MAILEILKIPDTVLKTVAQPVSAVDDDLRKLMDDMLETMYDAPGIGLAAPQVGVSKRVVVLDCAKREATEDEPEVEPNPIFLINPKIEWASDDASEYEEGCLSIPDVFEKVTRPSAVKISYLDRDGNAQEMDCTGILSTCVQHEIDHLNGILFIDHISRLKRERITRKFAKAKRLAAAG